VAGSGVPSSFTSPPNMDEYRLHITPMVPAVNQNCVTSGLKSVDGCYELVSTSSSIKYSGDPELYIGG
jgi:hypothetical protein